MIVKELIQELQKHDPDREIGILCDGADRQGVGAVYLAKSKKVILAPSGEVIYYNKDRPIGAPTEKKETYWYVPIKE